MLLNRVNFKLLAFPVLLGSLVMGTACSKKETKSEGDASADSAVTPTDVGPSFGAAIPELPAVYFAYNSFVLTSESKATLARHADWLKANGTMMVQIEGHTDERGTTEYNLALGERRAGAVRDFLMGRGVSAGQVSTISYGEERPAVPGEGESAWAKNRRGEFVSGGGR